MSGADLVHLIGWLKPDRACLQFLCEEMLFPGGLVCLIEKVS